MRNLFIVAVLLSLPILYAFEALPQLISIILLQVTYYGVCKYLKYEPIKTGDSSYYLGFMLTLLALFMSFTPSINSEFSFDANEILGNFGVAISSTILGIFFRIIEVQYSSLSDEDVTQANIDVTESLRNFAARIKVIEKDFEETSSALVNFYNESLSLVRKEGDEFIELSKKRDQQLKADLDLQRGEIRSSVDSIFSTIESKSLDYFSKFSQRLDKDLVGVYQESHEAIERKLKAFFDVLEVYKSNSGELFQSFSTIGRSTKNIEEYTQELVTHSKAMKASADESRKQYEQNVVHMASFNASVEKIGKEGRSITKVFDSLNSTVDSLKLRIQDMSDNTEELDKLVNLNVNQEKRLDDMTKIRDDAVAVNKELSSAVVDSAKKLLKALA